MIHNDLLPTVLQDCHPQQHPTDSKQVSEACNHKSPTHTRKVSKVCKGKSVRPRNPEDHRRKYTKLQAEQLDVRFEKSNYIKPKERVELAEAIGLSDVQVRVWFQNQRAKKKNKMAARTTCTNAKSAQIRSSIVEILKAQQDHSSISSEDVDVSNNLFQTVLNSDEKTSIQNIPQPHQHPKSGHINTYSQFPYEMQKFNQCPEDLPSFHDVIGCNQFSASSPLQEVPTIA